MISKFTSVSPKKYLPAKAGCRQDALRSENSSPPSAVIVKRPPGTVSTKFPHCFMISRIIYVGIGFKRENKSFPTATGIKFPMLRSANIFIRQCISFLLFFWHHL